MKILLISDIHANFRALRAFLTFTAMPMKYGALGIYLNLVHVPLNAWISFAKIANML